MPFRIALFKVKHTCVIKVIWRSSLTGHGTMTSWYGGAFRIAGPFVRWIHRSPMDYPHKGPVMLSFDNVFVTPEKAVEHIVDMQVIWDTLTLMLQQWYGNRKSKSKTHQNTSIAHSLCHKIVSVVHWYIFDTLLWGGRLYQRYSVSYMANVVLRDELHCACYVIFWQIQNTNTSSMIIFSMSWIRVIQKCFKWSLIFELSATE